jgi:hypothetical protein
MSVSYNLLYIIDFFLALTRAPSNVLCMMHEYTCYTLSGFNGMNDDILK